MVIELLILDLRTSDGHREMCLCRSDVYPSGNPPRLDTSSPLAKHGDGS